MKIKTCELSGRALNHAVAVCEGVIGKRRVLIDGFYSTSWREGGPIIERERIEVRPGEESEGWFASIHNIWMFMPGSTALIAAMRCYVASKLGDEVDIPEELV